MNKIICPTDFSDTANNAVEYAARLAQSFNVRLEVMHVLMVPQGAGAYEPDPEGEQKIGKINQKLQRMCTRVADKYAISCDFILETTTSSLRKAICSKSADDGLLVLGTNGTDDLFQYIFGTNSYNITRKSKCPVLIVPAGITYKPFEKIVFAWDYQRDNQRAYSQLKEIITGNPEMIFLHISREKTVISDEVFKALREKVFSYVDEKDNIRFERLFSADPDMFPELINEYMEDCGADALAITNYDRGALKNIFHGAMTRNLCEIAQYPLLVIHN